MAFLDKLTDIASKIGDKASDIAQNIGDKTSDVIETGKLNSKINSEKNEEAKLVKQLGELFYAKYQAGELDGFGEDAIAICEEAQAHTKAIEELQAQVEAIKAETAAEKAAKEEAKAAKEEAKAAAKVVANGGSVCVSCGAHLPADAKFCGTCGTRVEEKPKGLCSCGAQNAEDAKFCGSCGAKL